MLKLFQPGKKRVIFAPIVVVALVALLVALLIIQKKSTEPPQPQTVSEALGGTTMINATGDEYATKLEKFASTTDNISEKARAYMQLGNYYNQKGMPKEALVAYQQAQQLQDAAGLSEAEKAIVNGYITMEEQSRDFINSQPEVAPNPFEEPNE